MVSNLILKDGYYYCNNCRMRQPGIPPRCQFCECWFSNYEDTILEYRMNQYEAEINRKKEEIENESNLH